MLGTFTDSELPCRAEDVRRSPGLHVSDVLRSIERSLGWARTAEGWDMNVAAEVGFIWEELLSLGFVNLHAHRPGELEMDGIVLTPDAVGPDPQGQVHLVLEEYKATWRSSRTTIPTEVWYWIAQSKAYCRAVGTTVVIFRILHLMGDYRGSGPLYREARIIYTLQELEDNWQMILQHAKERGML